MIQSAQKGLQASKRMTYLREKQVSNAELYSRIKLDIKYANLKSRLLRQNFPRSISIGYTTGETC